MTSRSTRLAVAGALAVVIALLGAPAAQAHSVLIGADPKNRSEVSVSPTTVTLTFNEALQTGYPALTVVGPGDAKDVWSTGAATISGPHISTAVSTLGAAGVYRVNYRVTSADGHVVTGQTTFTLTKSGGGQPVKIASNKSSGGIPFWPFIVGAVLVFLVAVVLASRFGRRKPQ